MSERYDPKTIEPKWQKKWEEQGAFSAYDDSEKPKYYCLIEFPYPSGQGLHIGHIRSNTAMDIVARKRRMEGFDVLYPIGWDAFGLPTENYAIKTGIHPREVTRQNTDNFRRQLKSIGFSFDWSREINTTDPEYFKWTQWIFLQMLDKGLAYKAKMMINWCPSCKIGLANEEVVDGKCERCGNGTEKREKEQWMLAITKYADRLHDDLDTVDYLEKIKIQQRNWIGRSEGTVIRFQITNPNAQSPNKTKSTDSESQTVDRFIDVFTTRVDTLFGCTYVVVAPEHPLIREQLTVNSEQGAGIRNMAEVEAYLEETRKKTEMDRTAEGREKTGVRLEGIRAVNPINGEEVPVFVADYVLGDYGTGAVMAVPAHDERDFAFAKKYGLPIREVVMPHLTDKKNPPREGKKTVERNTVHALVRNPKDGKFLCLEWKNHPWTTFIVGGVEDGEDVVEAARREVLEETGFSNLRHVATLGRRVRSEYFAAHKDENRIANTTAVLFELEDGTRERVVEEEEAKHSILWLSLDEIRNREMTCAELDIWLAWLDGKESAFTDDGVLRLSNRAELEKTEKTLKIYERISREGKKQGIDFWVWGGLACAIHAGVIYRTHDDLDIITKRDVDFEKVKTILSSLGFRVIREKPLTENLVNLEFSDDEGFVVDIGPNVGEWGLQDSDLEEKPRTLAGVSVLVVSREFSKKIKGMQLRERDKAKDRLGWEYLNGNASVKNGAFIVPAEFEGLSSAEARERIAAKLEAEGNGKKVVKYKLRDWVFSRQRYWGEPIPVVHCGKCGIVPLPESELPLELPEIDGGYGPTDTGESPLAKIESWVNTTCPSCGGPARRETDTMPNWAGSSWYFLRYADPKNGSVLADPEKLTRYMPVDWYNGGMEHTTLHLLYSRFWNKFLYDIGVAPTSEPYRKRTSHGLILAEGGVKMSKSKGNVVNPDDIVSDFGADTLRVYEMFMGPFDQHIAWGQNGLVGSRRFLERIWKLSDKVRSGAEDGRELLFALHGSVKKVSEDIEAMRFNTAVSSMMILVNVMEKEPSISADSFGRFLRILSPFAPHIAEELWERLDNPGSVSQTDWPEADPAYLVSDTVKIVVQVNGKVRDSFEAPAVATADDLKARALGSDKVKPYLDGKEPKRVIVVPGKLVNVVT